MVKKDLYHNTNSSKEAITPMPVQNLDNAVVHLTKEEQEAMD